MSVGETEAVRGGLTSGAGDWQPVTRTRTYELVIDAIEEQILSGSLSVGDPLPPERDLAAKLAVSRPAVREALRVLEAQGVVRSAVGSGSGAGTFVASMPGEALSRFLRLHIALANFAFTDITEARVTLESSSVALAARATDPDRLVEVFRAMTLMEGAGDDRTAFNDADTAFHTAIAEAGGNRLVTAMTVAIRNALRTRILLAFQEVDDWPRLRDQLMDEHRGILAAIDAGDAELASRLSEQHIRDSYSRLPGLHGPEAGGEDGSEV
ncbi:FadR/GntR family transcriptional regulator [Gordonia insulae]|uniref:Pyruvate dehydrogenase complex repressor n=1 Tax=Gordonia insulae TaxID=2420509 RepID=A0A3G8JLA3_9ACTN|nr:FadR/GntR family transcriptional regulator [Gordonia insulae]AZG45658.1 Pyruvate dehydrogenase complex repressor [Gordonia insulae]